MVLVSFEFEPCTFSRFRFYRAEAPNDKLVLAQDLPEMHSKYLPGAAHGTFKITQYTQDSNRFRYKIAFLGKSWDFITTCGCMQLNSCVHAFIDCKPHLQVAFQAWNQSALAFDCDLLGYKTHDAKIVHDSHENHDHETPKCQPCSNPRAHIQGLAPSENEFRICGSHSSVHVTSCYSLL